MNFTLNIVESYNCSIGSFASFKIARNRETSFSPFERRVRLFNDFWIDISIEEYGEIGEYVRGTISGSLTVENYPGLVDIYMYFNVRRMR